MTRVVAITGISGGIGRAIAEAFREAEWTVAGIDLAQPSAGERIDAFLALDLAGLDVEASLGDFFATLGRLDAIVNGAALQTTDTALATSAAAWDHVMAANARGAFLASKAAHPQLLRARGAVVNIASVHALATSTGAAAYAASKGALTALTRSLALEWAPEVRVNAVIPGAVDTPMLRAGLSRSAHPLDVDEATSALERRTPLQRVGRPAEIGQAVLFMADAARSSFITGQTLVVDGGALARLSTE